MLHSSGFRVARRGEGCVESDVRNLVMRLGNKMALGQTGRSPGAMCSVGGWPNACPPQDPLKVHEEGGVPAAGPDSRDAA
jgi:hypothetical protein